jgi:hypothetical protein
MAREVSVVVAWLDLRGNGRVLYVATGKLRLISNPKTNLDALDLNGGETEEFLFMTEEPTLVPLLGESRFALWGISQ